MTDGRGNEDDDEEDAGDLSGRNPPPPHRPGALRSVISVSASLFDVKWLQTNSAHLSVRFECGSVTSAVSKVRENPLIVRLSDGDQFLDSLEPLKVRKDQEGILDKGREGFETSAVSKKKKKKAMPRFFFSLQA